MMGLQEELVQALDDVSLELLQRFGFEEVPFAKLQEKLRASQAGVEGNRLSAEVCPPRPGDLRPLPPLGSDSRHALVDRGVECIRRGEVAAVILAGGMATRFGGAVKAGVEAVAGMSFLAAKLADIRAVAERLDAVIPVYVMSSFATDEALRHLAAPLSSGAAPIEIFPQFISLRLTPDAELFRDAEGKPSLYAPGHGDLSFALRRAGILERFIDQGGRYLFMSNVDNLTATLDPAIVGAHALSGKAMTAEMAPKEDGDQGGAPARVDGRLQIVESFRFPADFDQDSIPVFNTNTFVISAAAIEADFPLSWFAVNKKIDGKDVVQFEHLVGELSAFIDCGFLRVERHGPDARFQPIKTPEDLESQRAQLEEILKARGVLG